MRHSIPYSPFATCLSGSAGESELRLRNIFQWERKRPPVVVVLLTAVMIQSCFGLVSCQKKTMSDIPHVYDTLPGSDDWVAMTPEERRASCAVSRAEVENMTTTALLTTVLDYPYLIDMLAFNSLQAGIDAVSSSFPGLPEFLARKDARQELEEYMKASPFGAEDYDLKWQYAQTLAMYLDGTFLSLWDEGEQNLAVVDLDILQERREYPVNSRGETYGSDSAQFMEEKPNLVLVQNADGVLGYARMEELNGFDPSNPEEATEYMQSYSHARDVTMYLQDGETVVGTFHVDE